MPDAQNPSRFYDNAGARTWVKQLRSHYEQHYCDLDHKDCYELAELVEEQANHITILKAEAERLKRQLTTQPPSQEKNT